MFFTEDFLCQLTSINNGDRKSKISRREKIGIKLKRVRYAKMKESFKTDLNIVNEILEKDTEFYETKFVKTQILEEGFGMTENAKVIYPL